MINYTPKLFIVVGNPASGKDQLIRAVNTLGKLHADIVPKHTDRSQRIDDGNEMICKYIFDINGNLVENPNYSMERCNIHYENYKTRYGVDTDNIWEGLSKGVHQVLVVSNIKALNQLKQIFGNLAVIIYIYSEVTKEEYLQQEKKKFKNKESNYELSIDKYLKERENNFDMAYKLYEENFMVFDHVFIFTDREEDLYDQIFRLFRYYENRR